jgi:hypothetical protein
MKGEIMNAALNRRLVKIEEKILPPKLSPAEAMLCDLPGFRKMVADMGLDIDQIIRTGDLWGNLPRHFVKQILEGLRKLNAQRSNQQFSVGQ